jgi:hypothetical protein
VDDPVPAPSDWSLRINRFKMGRGTGHLAVLGDAGEAVLASSACFSAAAARRRLLFRASSDGQHFARSMRRTARLDALLRACVSDSMVWGTEDWPAAAPFRSSRPPPTPSPANGLP